RDEPVSVQQGVIASYSKLHGKIGIFDAPYTGHVYVVDAITNNPGAGGGVITTRKGELLGLIGKELRNELTNTWINYALPINARVKINIVEKADSKEVKEVEVGLAELLEEKENYAKKYPRALTAKKSEGGGGYTGIVLVPNVVERTPPYVDAVDPGSPAQTAGLKPDDLIVYVDGLPVAHINAYRDVIDKYRRGGEVKLEVRRGDRLQTVTLKLTAPPRSPEKETPKPPEK